MGKIILMLLIVVAANTNCMAMGFMSGNDFLRSCSEYSKGQDPKSIEEVLNGSYCLGYVMGMSEMNVLYGTPSKKYFCFPNDKLEAHQQLKIAVKHMEQNPKDLHLTARILIVRAFNEAFPCK